MKKIVVISETDVCGKLYNLHTTSQIVQQEEERYGTILDANYSKVDINFMVNGLDIAKAIKLKLKGTLKKFSTLFEEV